MRQRDRNTNEKKNTTTHGLTLFESHGCSESYLHFRSLIIFAVLVCTDFNGFVLEKSLHCLPFSGVWDKYKQNKIKTEGKQRQRDREKKT